MNEVFESLSEERRERLIRTGIAFMSEIYSAYGPDKGTEVWDDLTRALDTELKGQILLSLLTGERDGTVLIKAGKFGGNRVSFIKALREFSAEGFGLKEAKDLVDALLPMPGYNHTVKHVNELIVDVKPGNRGALIDRLRELGLEAY